MNNSIAAILQSIIFMVRFVLIWMVCFALAVTAAAQSVEQGQWSDASELGLQNTRLADTEVLVDVKRSGAVATLERVSIIRRHNYDYTWIGRDLVAGTLSYFTVKGGHAGGLQPVLDDAETTQMFEAGSSAAHREALTDNLAVLGYDDGAHRPCPIRVAFIIDDAAFFRYPYLRNSLQANIDRYNINKVANGSASEPLLHLAVVVRSGSLWLDETAIDLHIKVSESQQDSPLPQISPAEIGNLSLFAETIAAAQASPAPMSEPTRNPSNATGPGLILEAGEDLSFFSEQELQLNSEIAFETGATAHLRSAKSITKTAGTVEEYGSIILSDIGGCHVQYPILQLMDNPESADNLEKPQSLVSPVQVTIVPTVVRPGELVTLKWSGDGTDNFEGTNDAAQVYIVDAIGRIVQINSNDFSNLETGLVTFRLTHLSPGVYFSVIDWGQRRSAASFTVVK